MNRIVFLLEERSMKILLDSLLPRLFPGLSFICLAHEGKQDLEKSIIRKLKAWKEPGVQFVIVRDNDDTDCLALKQKLKKLCDLAGRSDTLIRIVCQELEAWYFAEPKALVEAYGKSQLLHIDNKAKYRESDAIHKPSKEIVKLIPEFQKLSGAKLLAKHLTRKGNPSNSYCVFMDGIEQIFSQMQSENNILNAEIWVNDRCNERTGDNISHLIVKTKYGRPHSPEDWLSGPYPFPDDCNMFQWAEFETFIHFGKWDDAVQWLEKYAYQINPTKDLSLYCAFYINIAALYQQSGHYDKAIDVLKIIMKIIPKTNCHYSKALFYLCMGDISLSLGNTDFQEFDIDPHYKHFAEYFFKKGLHEAEFDGNPELQALAFLNMGNLYAVKGSYHEAITEYQNCYHECELSTKSYFIKQLKSNAGINIIRAKIFQKEYYDLIPFFNMVLVDIHDLPDSYDKTFRLLAICRLMHTIDDKQLNNHISPFIKEYLSKAFDMASQLKNNRLLSYTCGFIAQLLETESKYAIPLTKKAMMLAQENYQDLMFMWQWQLGRLFAKQLNISDAQHAYGSAIELLTPSKNIPPNCKHPCSGMLQSFLRGFRGSHLNFEKQVKPVYAAYCDLLLSQNKQEMTLKARNNKPRPLRINDERNLNSSQS